MGHLSLYRQEVFLRVRWKDTTGASGAAVSRHRIRIKKKPRRHLLSPRTRPHSCTLQTAHRVRLAAGLVRQVGQRDQQRPLTHSCPRCRCRLFIPVLQLPARLKVPHQTAVHQCYRANHLTSRIETAGNQCGRFSQFTVTRHWETL